MVVNSLKALASQVMYAYINVSRYIIWLRGNKFASDTPRANQLRFSLCISCSAMLSDVMCLLVEGRGVP